MLTGLYTDVAETSCPTTVIEKPPKRTIQKIKKKYTKIKKSDIEDVFTSASAQYNPGWNEALDLKNLIITAEAVTRAAIVREESRGAHTRLDFDGEREVGLKYNVVIKKTRSGMSAEKIPRDDPPKELADIAFASLNKLEGNGFGA